MKKKKGCAKSAEEIKEKVPPENNFQKGLRRFLLGLTSKNKTRRHYGKSQCRTPRN